MVASNLQSMAVFLRRMRRNAPEQSPKKEDVSLREHAFDYTKYTVTELRKFIKDRSGQIVPSEPERSQAYLIRILQNLDRNIAGFRFLDLPPEIRNEVYEHLLVHNKAAGRIAYLDLLCTSSFVYREGITILRGDSVVQLSAFFTSKIKRTRVYTTPLRLRDLARHPFGIIFQHTTFTARVAGDLNFTIDMDHNDIPSLIREQLRSLAHIKNLHLDLDFRERGGLPEQHQIHAWQSPEIFVRALVQLCGRLKYVRVTVTQRGGIRRSRVRVDDALGNLKYLDSRVKVELRGLPRYNIHDLVQRLRVLRALPWQPRTPGSQLLDPSSMDSSREMDPLTAARAQGLSLAFEVSETVNEIDVVEG